MASSLTTLARTKATGKSRCANGPAAGIVESPDVVSDKVFDFGLRPETAALKMTNGIGWDEFQPSLAGLLMDWSQTRQ
jgi:hypothetical protein